jgi:predicted TIM-barrel enzyme
MPYGKANDIVVDLGREVLTIVKHTPVIAGVCATDPFLLKEKFLTELAVMGFAGIQNFPTVGLIDGMFRTNLEETGMGYQMEVELIAAAHEMGLLTIPYVFNTYDAEQMVKAGADVLVAHMGLTSKGSIGAKTTKSLDTCISDIQDIVDTASALRPDVIVLCHGGPISTPADMQVIMDNCHGVRGFFGASSMERLPTETAITEQVRAFGKVRSRKINGRWKRSVAGPTLVSRERNVQDSKH